MKYKWKEYSVSVPVKISKKMLGLFHAINKCNQHELDYIIQTDVYSSCYKRYRRGKNRCKRCGVKINAK